MCFAHGLFHDAVPAWPCQSEIKSPYFRRSALHCGYMPILPGLELVSFELCPFVQRSIITLYQKNVPFKLTHIDLENPPHWFEEISPLGKVPVLKVGGRDVLFESAVINEYIDEITPPSLHSSEPLTKARDRAWIEFGSEMLGVLYVLMVTDSEEYLEEKRFELFEGLGRMEEILPEDGGFFRGPAFSLVDAAWAPLFVRLQLFLDLDSTHSAAEWEGLPKVRRWSQSLLGLESVQRSVPRGFREKSIAYSRAHGSILIERLGQNN